MFALKLILFSFAIPLVLIVVAYFMRQRKWWSRLLFTCGFLWVYLPSTSLFAFKAASYWESLPVLTSQVLESRQPQAIVILSGGLGQTGFEYPEERSIDTHTLHRTRYGAELAKQYSLPVLTAGGILDRNQNIPLAESMAHVLDKEFNTPASYTESLSTTTAENAKYSAEILKASGITSIVLVSDAMHMPRAVMSYERYGFSVLPAPTLYHRNNMHSVVLKLIPSARSNQLSMRFFHEVLGYWVYHFFILPSV